MSKLDAAPPNTHAGGDDDALKAGALPINASNNAEGIFDVVAYQAEVPRWKRIKNHSLTQMMLLSVQAFCGPAMDDAIAGLGGGGLATPQTSNIANAVYYTMLAIGESSDRVCSQTDLQCVCLVARSSIDSAPNGLWSLEL